MTSPKCSLVIDLIWEKELFRKQFAEAERQTCVVGVVGFCFVLKFSFPHVCLNQKKHQI